MNPADRLLASLAAAFAPQRAAALLARLGSADLREVRAHAERLAPGSRAERLAALAAALAAAHRGAPTPPAPAERPRVAEILRAVRRGLPAPTAAPALARLCRERLGCL
ncbi:MULTISPECIES: hypothetical protein [Anaeromyxobacter]|uniref:hypothetical protein n=1 Tax=Anaeromyxobacter TaxID=161492 RepID=UPI001F5A3B3D|nr:MULTISPECIES: hypothetical protein [unclassified Anaeromyxobacter]